MVGMKQVVSKKKLAVRAKKAALSLRGYFTPGNLPLAHWGWEEEKLVGSKLKNLSRGLGINGQVALQENSVL